MNKWIPLGSKRTVSNFSSLSLLVPLTDKSSLFSGQEPGYASDPIYSFPALSEEDTGQAIIQISPLKMPIAEDGSMAVAGTLYISSPARYINGNLDTPLNHTWVGRVAASNALSRQYDYTAPTYVNVNNAVAWSMNGSSSGTNSRLWQLTLRTNNSDGINAGSGMAIFGCNYG